MDYRGSVLSFPVHDSLVEYNLLITQQGDQRGFHYHPEFTEYMIVVDGECEFKEFDRDGNNISITLKTGDSICIPAGVAHAFTALTDLKFVSMLTKQWDKCNNPIIRINKHGNDHQI